MGCVEKVELLCTRQTQIEPDTQRSIKLQWVLNQGWWWWWWM